MSKKNYYNTSSRELLELRSTLEFVIYDYNESGYKNNKEIETLKMNILNIPLIEICDMFITHKTLNDCVTVEEVFELVRLASSKLKHTINSNLGRCYT